jgi:catechol 2,3-dioxygenase-like lactoylglutathione lyase family enzyme
MFGEVDAFSGYSVNDKAEALRFYADVLGCDTVATDVGLELSFPNGHTVFLYEKADHEPAGFTVLNFPVDDIDKTVDDLKSKGVEMLMYEDLPAEQDGRGVLRGKTVGMGPNIAWFKDPAQNVLAVIED